MNAFAKDLVYAVRGLRRSPGFAFLAILTLALGIGANTAIFSVVHGAVLKPLPYPDPDRLVYITSQFPRLGFEQFWISTPEFVEFRDNNKAFSSVGAYSAGAVNLGLDRPIRPVSAVITDDLFHALGIRPLRGRGFTRADMAPGAPDVAILSYELWQSAFGGHETALGQVVPVDGVRTQIVGVMPPGMDVHDSKIEVWLPLTIDPARLPNQRGSHFLYLVGRLKPGVSLEGARADLERMLVRWPSNGGPPHVPNTTTHRIRFDPLKEDMVGGVRTAAWVLQAAVGFVLLIACANLASLILARAEARNRELAVRAALGAGRGRLLRQFMLEGLVLALAGASAGILLAQVGLDALLQVNPGIPGTADISVDPVVLLFTLGVAVVTGIVFGLVPLFRMSDHDLHEMLKESAARTTASRGRARTRSVLVVAEVALAVVLVVGAGLMLRTFGNLLDVDAGFDRSQMVTFRVVLPGSTYKPGDRPAFFDRLIARLRESPGVRSASAMSGLPPLRDVNANDTDFEDITPTEMGDSRGPIENVDYWQSVTVDYTRTMGIPAVEGRSFERTDIEGAPVVMVNETLARTFFPGRSAVGRRLKPGFGDKLPWFTIVGVLKDVKQKGVDAKTGTELYLLAEQLPRTVQYGIAEMNVVVRTSLPLPTLASTVQGIVQSMDRSLPVVGLRTMDEVFTETVSRPRFLALLLVIFAGIALTLAAVGSYGVLSWLVTERRSEIGVRMAVGADRGSVLRMILRQGLTLTGIGIVIGLLAALALTRLLASLLFGVHPTDPATLLSGVVFMSVVGLAACLVPALRATRVDPIVVLRAE
jgi:putative ABC transport system permease protein